MYVPQGITTTVHHPSKQHSAFSWDGSQSNQNNDGWQLNICDKRTSFPFDVIRYPHMDSTIPINIPYGVFTGLLYRRYRICTHSDGGGILGGLFGGR
jgi:hypothetical protein